MLIDFLLNEKFLIPFLSTLGASVTVLLVQYFQIIRKEKQKKLYAIAYMTDVAQRLLFINLHLLDRTVLPHLEALKKILDGDNRLLNQMFLTDEFDILNEKAFEFNVLTEEYKILIGNDNIELIQAYEAMIGIDSDNKTRLSFNQFTKENLKSQNSFFKFAPDVQHDLLNTYEDYLYSLEHEMKRMASFIVKALVPQLQLFTRENEFFFYFRAKGKIYKSIKKINNVVKNYESIFPEEGYIEKRGNGGIDKLFNK